MLQKSEVLKRKGHRHGSQPFHFFKDNSLFLTVGLNSGAKCLTESRNSPCFLECLGNLVI
jgi:hypothetical protein